CRCPAGLQLCCRPAMPNSEGARGFQRLTKKFDGQHDHAPYWRTTGCIRPHGGGVAISPGPGDVAAILSVRGLRHKRLSAITRTDRKSTRLNSSHVKISYSVFCL